MGSFYYPDAYGGPNLDFSGITQAAKGLAAGYLSYKDKQSIQGAWERSGGDVNKMVEELYAAGNVDAARKVADASGITGEERYGLDLEFDDQGNAYRMGARGNMIGVAPPSGGKFTQQQRWLNRGTDFTPVPASGVPGAASPVPIDIQGKQEAEETGKVSGQNKADLPNAIARSFEMDAVIDQALAHPGREIRTGTSQLYDPRAMIPGQSGKSYEVGPYKQVTGQAFLSSIQQFRGLGHLSDAEGAAGTKAATSLDLSQEDKDHEKSLYDLKALNMRGLIRSYEKAGKEIPQRVINAWADAEAKSNVAKEIPFQSLTPQLGPNEFPVTGAPQQDNPIADPRGAYQPAAGQPQGMQGIGKASPDGTVIRSEDGTRLIKRGGQWVPLQ
jgi:hypothetical protein